MPDTGDERTSFRLAVFAAVLVLTLSAGYGLGRLTHGGTATAGSGSAVGPTSMAGMSGMANMPGMTVDESQPHSHNGTSPPSGAADVGGLSLTAGGLTLSPVTAAFVAGRRQPFRFRIIGPGGAPVTAYAVVHDKPLHLIVIRRDLSGYRHVHPVMAPDGTWSVDLILGSAGSYRAVADFTAIVGGQMIATTLGADLTVPGVLAPVPVPPPARTVTTGGFTVTYEGSPRPGATEPVLMTVAGPGGAPAALQPYLGAFGHLVMFREGDLGYVHVHPEAQLVDGKVKFWLTAPGPGTYRMFFDFQVAGQVHTAAWTAVVN